MKLTDLIPAAYDFWRPNRYALKAFPVRDGKKHPFALIIPGGGYSMVCSFVEGAPVARELNKRGYAAFVLYYRCKKKAQYPAPMEDAARGLREILDRAEEFHVDTQNYSLWGSSASGHLAATVGLSEFGFVRKNLPVPAAVVLCYPVITMGPLTHEGSRIALLGKHPTAQEMELTSVERHVRPDAPPTFLWYGTADDVVDPQNSQMLAAALREKRIPYILRVYPDAGHGTGLGKGLSCEGWFDEAVSFWKSRIDKKEDCL